MDDSDITGLRGMTFEDFNLKHELLLALHEKNFESPTPIQESVISLILKRRNVIARAKNGTGKTGSYLIPIIQMIDCTKDSVQAIVLVPTRELALQVSQICKELCRYLNVKMMAMLGGQDIHQDVTRLKKGVHIIISTPSRIFTFIENKLIVSSSLFYLVLDEADKLIYDSQLTVNNTESHLDLLMTHIPNGCNKILISATYPAFIIGFIKKYMPHLVEINHMKELTLKNLTQFYAYLEETQKVQCLWTLFQGLRINQSIIFCNSTRRVEMLFETLKKLGCACQYIHSGLEQKKRTQVFHEFRNGSCRHLISSDLFCRGIDVASVNLVVNFDFPSRSAVYLHRIGRSGRYGRRGIAINFITEQNIQNMKIISKELKINMLPVPSMIDEDLYVDAADDSRETWLLEDE